jgi:hypothetical protein
MCAEAVAWRCHRSLVADALFARSIVVKHVQSARRATPHQLTPFAHVDGERIKFRAAPPKSSNVSRHASRSPTARLSRSNRLNPEERRVIVGGKQTFVEHGCIRTIT